ncbi:MAG: hypothetical protein A2107_11900 [Verrucomicrobia bacterium GWF2_62_7]|nr:MAG: hypothetical protein A2107_11900 [Verrucomicrobia bacterium GWF2_62_7]
MIAMFSFSPRSRSSRISNHTTPRSTNANSAFSRPGPCGEMFATMRNSSSLSGRETAGMLGAVMC